MDVPEFDFGRAHSIDAEAIGRPGQRRFRLMVRSTTQTASVWIEKQQLAGIGIWFEEVAERLDKEHPTDEPDVEPLDFPETPDVDFRAAQVGVGFSEEEQTFELVAYRNESDVNRTPSFRCALSRGQCRVLSRKIAAVVAAGRPICPFCEQPIDPDGHTCPKSNGHYAPANN
jgi:uncharacterized repeat protein (TIGR03847 family)